MDPLELAVLSGVALCASMLSAILGMAGGIILLTVMLLFLEPLVAIPLHGVIQLVSNGSRSVIQRRHVRWSLVRSYARLLVPGALLGLGAVRALHPEGTKLLIGLFVLLATWRPRWLLLGAHPQGSPPERRFTLLGGVAGFLQMTVGAVGPLIAPFFLDIGLGRQAIVGTKASVQALGHGTKILLFGFTGFAFSAYLGPLAAISATVIVGTWIGSRLLERVDERLFRWLFRGALTLVALRLVLWSGRALLDAA